MDDSTLSPQRWLVILLALQAYPRYGGTANLANLLIYLLAGIDVGVRKCDYSG